jgi:hypothetical protein
VVTRPQRSANPWRVSHGARAKWLSYTRRARSASRFGSGQRGRRPQGWELVQHQQQLMRAMARSSSVGRLPIRLSTRRTRAWSG